MFLNSGSYFLIQTFIMIIYVVSRLLNTLFKCCPQYRIVRKLAVLNYDPQRFNNTLSSLGKLLLESYFDLTFCVILSSNVLFKAFMQNKFSEYFSTGADRFASIVTILYILIMSIFLLYGYYITKKGSTQNSIFFEGIKTNSKW